MQPRDLFDVVVLGALAVSLYVGQYGVTSPSVAVWTIVEAVLSIDLVFYLVLGGIFGVVFVGYIAVYLPRKQSERISRR